MDSTVTQTAEPTLAAADETSAGRALVVAATEMLLEYNVRSATLSRQIRRLASAVGVRVEMTIAYCDVALCFEDGRCIHVRTPEYRINDMVRTEAVRLIDEVCAGTLDPAAAIPCLHALRKSGSVHGRWRLALIFAPAASALAMILHADLCAVVVTGISSALGLLARKELAKRHWPLFSLPFVAAMIGGVLGGLAVHQPWTQTTGLCLLVPALMLVPGPHLINGVADIFENQIQSGVCRLALAIAILLAAAMGVMAGGALLTDFHDVSAATSDAFQLNLVTDVVLAGIAACGFGAFYNSPWRVLWISIVGGMVGHGIRFVCLANGTGLPMATFAACVPIGLLASACGRRLHLPFSSVSFAAAVPMMPGALVYRSIAGAVRLSVSASSDDPVLVTATVGLSLQAALVVGAMAAGLFAGTLAASAARGIARFLRRTNRLSQASDTSPVWN